nr:DUF5693 family protein [Paenibacillus sp. NEAU-GSW1]
MWLWIITLIGVIAALPLGLNRMTMESTSKQVEYVFDYRDLLEIAEVQARPQEFVKEQLVKMQHVGITTMSLYESSLRELQMAGRLNYYSSKDAAALQGKLEKAGQNFTYILFTSPESEEKIGPIVRAAYDRVGAVYSPWSFDGRNGMIVELPIQDAVLKPLTFDPMTLETIRGAGFHVLLRFSDRVLPYDEEAMDKLLGEMKEKYGVTRILFDGDKVKGYTDQAELRSINSLAETLNKYGMGVATIENLKKPQAGINKIAFITNYNVVRLYSLSDNDAMGMTPDAIADRFLLAAKDRNIRMFFLNGSPQSSMEKSAVVDSLDNMYMAMMGEVGKEGAVKKLTNAGFPSGIAQPFDVERPSYAKPLKMVVAAGAVALIALLINTFLPGVLIPVFLLGLVGSAGLYVLKGPMMEQALALGAAIAAPTLALVWVMNRVYSRTVGNMRFVGGSDWTLRSATVVNGEGAKWIFDGLAFGRRLWLAIVWFIVTALISLTAVPLVFGLLNNITYSLVLEQFRGVGLLHLAPIGLTAIYVLLYTGEAPVGRVRRLLNMPITVLMVVAGVVLAAAGLYYLSRTGNAGTTLPFEPQFRAFLESTFGVRPRNKEFLLSHPLFLAGLFLALRYRAAWVLVIVGSIGQLSMVDTFAHIHTPLYISIIRVFLGLGLGAIFGLILIGVCQVAEGVWRKWSPAWKKKLAE